MKTTTIFFTFITILSSCSPKPDKRANTTVGIDTTGLYKNNSVADSALTTSAILPGTVSKRIVETRSQDGNVTITTTTVSTDNVKGLNKTVQKNRAIAENSTGVNATRSNAPSAATSTVKKKGWSNRAKGAAIGGVSGAVVGAAVSKKKGKGAIIGGAVGAAGGYIIGNEKDKKKNE